MRVTTASDDAGDKAWARRYILDPLTAPEPSQETGPGASHALPRRAPLRNTAAEDEAEEEEDEDADEDAYSYWHGHPTPPSSASPTRARFHLHPSNPFAAGATSSPHQPLRRLDTHDEESFVTPPGSPQTLPCIPIAPQQQQQRHRQQQHQHQQHQHQQHRRYPSVPLAAAPSWADAYPDHPRHPPRPRSNTTTSRSSTTRPSSSTTANVRRQPSLAQRFPGDMSHRPLDMLRADARAADRRPARHRKRLSETDTIDALDTIGGAYHHGGPFDATLASRNLDEQYSPVAAVRRSNMEALRATPRENIADSLQRHVPLQGTASVPAGARDLGGNVMRYAEGADLMREPDAAGGAYKRWPGVAYHPDDLKGKGEPSFTVERALKAAAHRAHASESAADAYEMQPARDAAKLAPAVRQRSVSNAAEASSTGAAYGAPGADLQRSHSTGRKISEGLKRRFGSLRRKKAPVED